MARKKYTAEEIIQNLRTMEIEQAKGKSFDEAARKIGVSKATAARWKKEYGGLGIEQARRLKELEAENTRLKKIVANMAIDNSILKEAARGNF
jgi:putative transposase